MTINQLQQYNTTSTCINKQYNYVIQKRVLCLTPNLLSILTEANIYLPTIFNLVFFPLLYHYIHYQYTFSSVCVRARVCVGGIT